MNQIIYIGSIEEYLKLDKNKTKDPDKYKKFEIVVDINKLRKEVNKMTDQNDDEKRFSAEELKVDSYIKSHPGVDYRTAVLNSLDASEEKEGPPVEFAELDPDEVLKASKNLEEAIYNMSQAKESNAFNEADKAKILQAYNLLKQVKENLDTLVEKNK